MSTKKQYVMRYLLILILAFSFIGCDKDKDNTVGSFTEGVYNGTFQRKTNAGGKIVGVILYLNSNGYNGAHDNDNDIYERYPVIGLGTYSVSAGKISFLDSLYYTADFDWTLILSGEYDYSVNGDNLTITRQYNNGVKDIYKLRKGDR